MGHPQVDNMGHGERVCVVSAMNFTDVSDPRKPSDPLSTHRVPIDERRAHTKPFGKRRAIVLHRLFEQEEPLPALNQQRIAHEMQEPVSLPLLGPQGAPALGCDSLDEEAVPYTTIAAARRMHDGDPPMLKHPMEIEARMAVVELDGSFVDAQ